MMNIVKQNFQENIFSRDNLTLCSANYYETCWCRLNSTEPLLCPYLLHHVKSFSNSTYFCVYHKIRMAVECFNSSTVFPITDFVSSNYISLTIILFIIGLIGNGLSIMILFDKTLRCLSVYRNLAILCILNIFYLFAVLIRHTNLYHQDLRSISPNICRLHTFIVAFTGHLCSWQLVSTSIQRVNALLSLQVHGQTSWISTLSIFGICIILPLFIFDSQILLNYGLFYNHHTCEERFPLESRQLQRARQFPIEHSAIPIPYQTNYYHTRPQKSPQCDICIFWNIIDTFIYAIIPFLIILITSIIIIIKICKRRRSTILNGGICHTNRRILARQDNLSILLIILNCLFLIMTGPFNICLIIQSILKHFLGQTYSMKILLQLTDYLRSLQNSYHALSFLFYCVIGNKFRKSSWLISRRIYRQICQHPPERSSIDSVGDLEHRTIVNHRRTITTSANENIKRTDITVITTENRVKILDTYV